MSSFVSESGHEAILKETNPTTADTKIVMQISISPPPDLSIPSGQTCPPHGHDSPVSQAMATTPPPQQDPTTPPPQQDSQTAFRRRSFVPKIPISYTMAKLTRQPSPPLPLAKPTLPRHLAPHQHRALTANLCKAAQTISLTTTTPLAFLDHVTHLHNNLSSIPTHPIPATAKATIYDKLTLLTLLFHSHRILLLIPPRSTTGYKPPACTYNAETMHSAMGNCTITQILQKNLTETLRVHPKRTFMPLVNPIHEPCFGPLRLPGQGADVWIIAQIFEVLPIPAMEDLKARIAQGPGRLTINSMGRMKWNPNPEKVQVMKWFDERMVRESKEIDGLTRKILLVAFEGQRKIGRDVAAAMSML